MEILPDWWREWIDNDTLVMEPLKLKESAPEEVKQKFEEWKQRKEQERAEGKWI